MKTNLFILTLLSCMLFSFSTLKETSPQNKEVGNNDKKRITFLVKLKDLEILFIKADFGIYRWYSAETKPDEQFKIDHQYLLSTTYPNLKKEILSITESNSDKSHIKVRKILNNFDKIILLHESIMTSLSSFEAYADTEILLKTFSINYEISKLSEANTQELKNLINEALY